MEKRAAAYRKFRDQTGLRSFRGYSYPSGSINFWNNALTITLAEREKNERIRIENSEIIKQIERLTLSEDKDDEFIFKNTGKEARENLIRSLRKSGEKFVFKYIDQHGNEVYRTINEQSLELIRNLDAMTLSKIETYGSDGDAAYIIKQNSQLVISKFYVSNHKRNRAQGQFFRYHIKAEIPDYISEPWKRYGIFKSIDLSYQKMNCFYHAIREHNILEVDELLDMAFYMDSMMIPKTVVKEIATQFDIKINVYSQIEGAKTDRKHEVFGTNNRREFFIGLIDEHYFIIDNKTNITSFCLDNYEKVKNKSKPNMRIKLDECIKPQSDNFVDSFKLFKLLIKNKDIFLDLITMDTPLADKLPKQMRVIETESLEFTERNYKPKELKKKKDNGKQTLNLFFDTETKPIQDKESINYGKHELIYGYSELVTLEGKVLETKEFKDIFAFKNYLGDMDFKKYFPEGCNINLIAHNIAFDIRIISSGVKFISLIEKGTRTITGSILVNGRKYKLVDSYAFITEPLHKFGEMFGLEQGKEAFCFDWLKYGSITVKQALEIAKRSDQYCTKDTYNKFEEDLSISMLDFVETGKIKNIEEVLEWKFDHVRYMKYYCKKDVETLRKGFTIFREWMIKTTTITKQDKDLGAIAEVGDFIDIAKDVCTVSSLADRLYIMKGAYAGSYMFSGVVREFFQKAIVGGRCMTCRNEKQVSKEDSEDCDACSLYPSAMREEIVPIGIPKIIPTITLNGMMKSTMTWEELNNKSDYFVKVRFPEFKKKFDFPLMSEIDIETGTRIFTNELKQTHIVPKAAIEDVVNFYGIGYEDIELIQGYYFDQGHNMIMKKVTEELYNERNRLKKLGNPIEKCYKLILNSAYGKNIEKEHDVETCFFYDDSKMRNYVTRNSAYIKEWINIGGNAWKVKTMSPVDDHFSSPHIGANVLAYSKRIMNEAMCLAFDDGLKIYYQDTDSMMMPTSDWIKLCEAFEIKYGRKLNGKELGQMKSDFEGGKDEVVKSVSGIFLGKKSYYMKVSNTKVVNGENITKYRDLVRMKGIPGKCITYESESTGKSIEQIYENLYDGKVQSFDLSKGCAMLAFSKDMNVCSKSDFKRSLEF